MPTLKYDLLLFDADDTLLDFKRSELKSFEITLNKNSIVGNFTQLHQSYREINDHLWSQNALGIISKDYLKTQRFKLFLEKNLLTGDPEKLSHDYLESLPDNVFLVEGAMEVLSELSGKIPVVIVTNGIGVTQHLRLKKSGLLPYIKTMIVSEECGFNKPDKRIFDYTFETLQANSQKVRALMIGDKLETDILGAKNAGIDSCWFNPEQEKNPHENLTPHYEIQKLSALLKILK